MKEERRRGAAGWAGLIIALLIGLGVGYTVTKENKSPSGYNNNSKVVVSATTESAKLRADLVGLGVEGVGITSQVISSTIDERPELEAVKADLINNTEQISAVVGNIYGQEIKTKVKEIWGVNLNELTNYITAAKNGDQTGKDAAKSNIATNYTKPLAKLLADKNPNLSANTLESNFAEHIEMTTQMIDSRIAGNYEDQAKMREKLSKHISELMSLLAAAIVKQYPLKFQG